ncbi:protein activator of alkane oxidation PraB [Pseudomonas cedrina subsp. fulgida]|nr:protein activator of alkane oxidation PraB [Pseudomonas cedrina subsp. fulgida]
MKSLKTLVSLSALAVCMGAASMANAVSIAPVSSTFSASGSLTVKSPSSFQLPITCDVKFDGTVNGAGIASINTVTVSGSNNLCKLPKITGVPWTLTATTLSGSAGTGNVTNVGYTIPGSVFPASNCGPATVAVSYNNGTGVLTATPANQPLGSSCTLQSLSVTVTTSPLLQIVP